METFEPACPWHIQVGDLFIAPGRVPNSGTVWVGEVNGAEGGEFKTEELAKVLRKFYDDNF
ncbi:MAG: hypothetical protein ACKO0Z_13785 [Betaproteobacteria bacterium]